MAEYKLEIISDKEIEKLEKVKELLNEIKLIDSSFSISNVLEVDNDSILVFSAGAYYKEKDVEAMELMLSDKLKHQCIVLPVNTMIEKVLIKKKYVYDCRNGDIKVI